MDYGSQAPFGQFANQQSEFIGSSSIGQFATPKIAININNNGLPVDLAMDSTEMNGESMVLNASMKLAASNTNYRRMFVNKG